MQIEKPDCIEEKAKVILNGIMYDIDCINEENVNYLPDLLRGKLVCLFRLNLINYNNYNYLRAAIHERAVVTLKRKYKWGGEKNEYEIV